MSVLSNEWIDRGDPLERSRDVRRSASRRHTLGTKKKHSSLIVDRSLGQEPFGSVPKVAASGLPQTSSAAVPRCGRVRCHASEPKTAMNRPLFMSGGAAQFKHYAFTILLWLSIRLARHPRGNSLLRTLGYCAIELRFMAITSAVLMAAVSLFAGNVAAQALCVLGLYALVLAGWLAACAG
jgi:hypothetical protein